MTESVSKAPPRSAEQRKADTLARLENDDDAWVATAGPDGPRLVPLSPSWDGATLLFATDGASPTASNVRADERVRLALGHTRDVVMVHGTAHVLSFDEVSPARVDALAARLGSDPRTWATALIAVTPVRIQAWREENELEGRTLMRDGRWQV